MELGLLDEHRQACSLRLNAQQATEKGPQLRSRLVTILNVPPRVRLRLCFACGLVGWPV